MRPLFITLVLLGCAAPEARTRPPLMEPEAQGNEEVMRDDVLRQHGTLLTVVLDASTPEVTMGGREGFGFSVQVTNETGEEVELDASGAELRVNDLPYDAFRLSREGVSTLAPGESAGTRHENLGVRLFEEPGDYTLRLHIGDAVSNEVRVHVTE